MLRLILTSFLVGNSWIGDHDVAAGLMFQVRRSSKYTKALPRNGNLGDERHFHLRMWPYVQEGRIVSIPTTPIPVAVRRYALRPGRASRCRWIMLPIRCGIAQPKGPNLSNRPYVRPSLPLEARPPKLLSIISVADSELLGGKIRSESPRDRDTCFGTHTMLTT